MLKIKFKPYVNIYNWCNINWYYYLFNKRPSWRMVWCRMNGHPHGVVWYSSWKLEPDMRCKDCNEDLG